MASNIVGSCFNLVSHCSGHLLFGFDVGLHMQPLLLLVLMGAHNCLRWLFIDFYSLFVGSGA
ncbi:MAG: hypothetical protein R3B45_03565 [Bdellovibrionota bacterium]